MKILLVHPHIFKGGAEFQLIHFARGLQKLGHTVDILTLSVSDDIAQDITDLRLILPDKQVGPRNELLSTQSIFGELKHMFKMRRMLSEIGDSYDIINPHNFPAMWSCIGQDPIVWMCNEPPDPLWANPSPNILLTITRKFGIAIDNFLVRKSVKSIAVVDELNRERVKRRYHLDSDVVYSGVDYDYFCRGDPNKAVSKFNLVGNFVISHIGWFTPQKNQMASVKALEDVISRVPNIKLILVGRNDNAYGRTIRNYLTNSVVRNNVVMTGLVSMDDIRNIYAASDVVLFPTRSQTWGLSPLEGLCLGKVPIVSREAGVSYLLEQENIGIVSNNLGESIIEVYSNYQKYQQMADRGKGYVREHLSWNDYCKRMINVFEKVHRNA